MPAKRCPMCHSVSEPRAWRCRCGYEFGQDVEKLRGMLRGQRRTNRIALGVLLGLLAVEIAGAVFAVQHGTFTAPVFGFVLIMLGIARVLNKLAITRESLRQLDARDAKLPTARVVEKR